jgi:formamidopyrimidine-DNA glycosylase
MNSPSGQIDDFSLEPRARRRKECRSRRAARQNLYDEREVSKIGNIEAKEKKDEHPLCPHCGARIEELWFRQLTGFLGKRYVYFCPHCQKILGVSHRKGLLAG